MSGKGESRSLLAKGGSKVEYSEVEEGIKETRKRATQRRGGIIMVVV